MRAPVEGTCIRRQRNRKTGDQPRILPSVIRPTDGHPTRPGIGAAASAGCDHRMTACRRRQTISPAPLSNVRMAAWRARAGLGFREAHASRDALEVWNRRSCGRPRRRGGQASGTRDSLRSPEQGRVGNADRFSAGEARPAGSALAFRRLSRPAVELVVPARFAPRLVGGTRLVYCLVKSY